MDYFYGIEEYLHSLISVASIDDCAKRIAQEGGYVVSPKHPVTDAGYLAFFKNAEGALFGLWQQDTSAK
jgi:predicted enzyme related to lactoylglutathione lyase